MLMGETSPKEYARRLKAEVRARRYPAAVHRFSPSRPFRKEDTLLILIAIGSLAGIVALRWLA